MFIHSTAQQSLGGIVINNSTHSNNHSHLSTITDSNTVHVFKRRKLDATVDNYATGTKSNESYSLVKNNDNFIVPTSNVQVDGFVTKIKDDRYSIKNYSNIKTNCNENYTGVINKNIDNFNTFTKNDKFNEPHFKNSDNYEPASLNSNIDYLNSGSIRASSSRRSNTKNGSSDEKSPQHGAMAQTLVRASTIKLLDTYHRCGQKVIFYYRLIFMIFFG